MKHPFLPLAAVLAALAAPAGAAAPAGFAWGAPFEVAGYGEAGPALTNFPVLVRIAENAPSGFSYSQLRLQDGADLCFAGMDGAGLPFEIDTWNTNGESLVWVALPAMTNGTEFVMCWGGATSGKTVCADNPFAGYKGVWHMGSAAPADSSPNGFDGTNRTDNLSVVVGPVGSALNVPRTSTSDGATCGKVLPNSELVDGFTIEGWCRPAQYGNMGDGAAMFGKEAFVSLRINSATRVTLTTPGKSDHHMDFASGVLPATNTWWHFAATFRMNTANDGLRFYIDGRLARTQGAGDINNRTDATEMFLGNNQWNQAFKGDLDEIRLSAGLRSAEWIAATYATQADPAFLTAGEAGLLDAGAPTVSPPSFVRNADGTFAVSVVVSENDAAPGSVKCFAAGLEFPMSTTNDALPKTYAATLSGLPASTTLVYSVQARSATGDAINRPGATPFHTGDLAVAKIADADEDGLVPGVFRISRADTGPALPVAFALGGTAVEGRSYRAVPRTATIPAGSTHVDIEIHPLVDPLDGEPTTVVLALSPGLYGIAAPGEASLSIAKLVLPADRNTWIAADAGLASDDANWSFGHAPRAGEHVQFDGRFSSADCEWDALATHEVAAWTQHGGYTGTVTVCTVYPGKGDFTNLVVAGAMVVDAGSVTHPQSRVMADRHDETWDWVGDLKSNAVHRLRLSVGSLRVGAGAMIDARGRGYYVTNSDSAVPDCAHGGRMSAVSPPCYGDPREPVHIGMPFHRKWGNRWNGKGGGAVYVVASGAIVVDGTIRADSYDGSFGFTADSYGGAFGAAGSVCLCADAVSGSGTITADGPGNQEVGNTFPGVPFSITPDGNFKGTGGRVAIRTRAPVDRSTFARIAAEGFWMGSPTANWSANHSGGSGTVVFIDETRPNGLLVVSQQPNADPPSLRPDKTTYHRCPSVTTDGDWTFDAIEFGRRGFLRVPPGTTLSLPNGLASCYGTATDPAAYGGIRYEGGTIDAGAGDQTLSGNWMLFAPSNCVFSAGVVVTNGAAIGVPPITDVLDQGAFPDIVPTCSVEVAGDLLVGADAAIRAVDCGLVTTNAAASEVSTGLHAHGGRALFKGRDAAGATESRAFDSVFSPALPGCTGGEGIGIAENIGRKFQRSGGAVRLVVGGTLTLDGEATASGLPAERESHSGRTGGAGGSLDITAGRLAGAGSIRANGGNYSDYCGPGGRIAVRLTAPGANFSGFSGPIEAGGGSWWRGGTNSVRDASAGTVYLETAADGDRGGTIRIAMDPVNVAYILGATDDRTRHTNSNTTEMVSLGVGGDRILDYKHARYVVSDYGRAAVNADFKARSVTLADLTVLLDLEGNEILVDEFFYAVDDGNGGLRMRRLGAGSHSAAAIAALGATTVADSSAGAIGRVVVRGRETIMMLR